MWKNIFTQQRAGIDFFFENVNSDEVDSFFSQCAETNGFLVFLGIGKSGIIAEKIAMTIASTGTKALYLSAANLLHGDIGLLSADDLVIFLSKSGETEELISLLPYLKKRKIKTAALVCQPKSTLGQAVERVCLLPMEKELCPFDLAPTISTEIQLLFGDALAVFLMQKKGFTLDQYGENHPSGSIGKKTTLTVEEIMLKGDDIPTCLPEAPLQDVLVELSKKKSGCVIVVSEQQELLGVFTDGDLRRVLQAFGLEALKSPMATLMTKSAITVPAGILAWDAMKKMQENPKKWIMSLPVVSDSKVVGLVRMHDIIHAGIS